MTPQQVACLTLTPDEVRVVERITRRLREPDPLRSVIEIEIEAPRSPATRLLDWLLSREPKKQRRRTLGH